MNQAYAECASITRQAAHNFYYAFLTLPPARRRAIYAVYAYCRIVDDAADLAPDTASARTKLRELRQQLDDCLAGRPRTGVFQALADTCRRYHLRPEHLYAVLDGVEQDLTVTRYADFAALRDYCWHVASAVGLLCLQVFGYKDASAIGYAEDLGLAMQLTNILRDIREDLERGRVYLPQDELAAHGISMDQLERGQVNDQFRRFLAFQVQRARQYFASGARLAPLVNWSARACPLLLHAIYSRVLDCIENADYDVFSRRLGLSNRQKTMILFQTWSRCLLPLRR